MRIINVYTKSREEITLTDAQADIYNELKKEGHKVFVNRYGLKVSGRRTSWKDGFNLAFLGCPIGKHPKIVRTYIKN